MQLGQIIRDKMSDFIVQRQADFLLGLIVAVEMDAFCREARLNRGVKLAAGGDIQAKTLFLNNTADCLAVKGLAGIDGHASALIMLFKGALVSAAVAANLVFIHDIQRRAELLCQLHSIAAADAQMPLLIDL